MEHQRCYVYQPPAVEEPAAKRHKLSKHNPQAQLPERLHIYRNIWSQQEEIINQTLDGTDAAVQQTIVDFISTSNASLETQILTIPTALIVAGPSIASHGPFFERLGRKVKEATESTYVLLASGECPNLKTLLKNLIKKITSRIDEHEDDDDNAEQQPSSSRHGPKLLNYDLGHVHAWQQKSRLSSIVVAIQDSEAFDAALLAEMIDLFHSWRNRLPFVLLFGIATSAESFEDRLSGNSLRYLQGQKFDVTQSDEIIEKLFSATVAATHVPLRIGSNLCHRMLDRQKDHVQNVQDVCDGLKYAYMSHFYAIVPSILLQKDVTFQHVSADVLDAVRNLPSFRRRVEELLSTKSALVVRQLLESDEYLFDQCIARLKEAQQSLSFLSHATRVLNTTRQSLQLSPNLRLSSVFTRAMAGDIAESPLLRETMLSVRKIPSDRLVHLFASLRALQPIYKAWGLGSLAQELEELLRDNNNKTPLRTQHDVRSDSLRTTVVAQKVLLSKHKAALSEQDRAYSDIVSRFHDKIDGYFTSAFINPQSLFLSEVVIYDLKSPHTEVFQPRPRFAIERALASPRDYLNCDCCSGVDGCQGALSATQPATAIVYQLYLESGNSINVSDLWSAFKTIAGTSEDEEDQPTTMALFQRALAELKYLGLVKPSRKKTDHIAKVMWKGL